LPGPAICASRDRVWQYGSLVYFVRFEFENEKPRHESRARDASPPVHMIKLTQEREIAPYTWVYPDDDDRR
jgi:hypothetical protein